MSSDPVLRLPARRVRVRALVAVLVVSLVASLLAVAPGRPAGAIDPPMVTERALWVFGANKHGQLGAGPVDNVMFPLEALQTDGVSGIGDPVEVAFGGQHTLAIPADPGLGVLLVAGRNDKGQLGNGGYLTRDRFDLLSRDLFDGASLVDVAAGPESSFAVDDRGRLWAWGANGDGQLGLADPGPVPVPTLVPLPAGTWASAVAAGPDHTVVLTLDGEVLTAGANTHGQLGRSGPTGTFGHVELDGGGLLSGVVEVDAGAGFTVARTGADPLPTPVTTTTIPPVTTTVPPSTTTVPPPPTTVPGNRPPQVRDDVALSDGGIVTVPVTDNDSDVDGSIDRYSVQITSGPVAGPGATTGPVGEASIVTLPAGELITHPGNAIRFTPASGFRGEAIITYSVADDKGARGHGTVFVMVGGTSGGPWTQANVHHSVTAGGLPVVVNVLGNDVGNPNRPAAARTINASSLRITRYGPAETAGTVTVSGSSIVFIPSAVRPAAGYEDIFYRVSDTGCASCRPGGGALLPADSRLTRVRIHYTDPVVGFSAAEPVLFNGTGQVSAPAGQVEVLGVSGVAQAAPVEGAVFAWGNGVAGQLGHGQQRIEERPVRVLGLDGDPLVGVADIAAGDGHVLAVTDAGELLGWGSGSNGQLTNDVGRGADPEEDPETQPWVAKWAFPMDVPGSAVEVAAGAVHSLVRTDLGVFVFGDNNQGQLGVATLWEEQWDPLAVGVSGAARVFAGANHSGVSAVSGIGRMTTSGSQLFMWGPDNRYGRIPTGREVVPTVPVEVRGPSGSGSLSDVAPVVDFLPAQVGIDPGDGVPDDAEYRVSNPRLNWAVLSNGHVYVWGPSYLTYTADMERASGEGAGGNGFGGAAPVPHRVTEFEHLLAAGEKPVEVVRGRRLFIRTSAGRLLAHGCAEDRLLGRASTDVRRTTPGPVPCASSPSWGFVAAGESNPASPGSPMTNVVDIAVSDRAATAVRSDGRAYSWGETWRGTLSNFTVPICRTTDTEPHTCPYYHRGRPVVAQRWNGTAAATLTGVVQVERAYDTVMFRLSNGQVWMAGQGNPGTFAGVTGGNLPGGTPHFFAGNTWPTTTRPPGEKAVSFENGMSRLALQIANIPLIGGVRSVTDVAFGGHGLFAVHSTNGTLVTWGADSADAHNVSSHRRPLTPAGAAVPGIARNDAGGSLTGVAAVSTGVAWAPPVLKSHTPHPSLRMTDGRILYWSEHHQSLRALPMPDGSPMTGASDGELLIIGNLVDGEPYQSTPLTGWAVRSGRLYVIGSDTLSRLAREPMEVERPVQVPGPDPTRPLNATSVAVEGTTSKMFPDAVSDDDSGSGAHFPKWRSVPGRSFAVTSDGRVATWGVEVSRPISPAGAEAVRDLPVSYLKSSTGVEVGTVPLNPSVPSGRAVQVTIIQVAPDTTAALTGETHGLALILMESGHVLATPSWASTHPGDVPVLSTVLNPTGVGALSGVVELVGAGTVAYARTGSGDLFALGDPKHRADDTTGVTGNMVVSDGVRTLPSQLHKFTSNTQIATRVIASNGSPVTNASRLFAGGGHSNMAGTAMNVAFERSNGEVWAAGATDLWSFPLGPTINRADPYCTDFGTSSVRGVQNRVLRRACPLRTGPGGEVISDVADVSISPFGGTVALSSGEVLQWGRNENGILGVPPMTPSESASPLSSPAEIYPVPAVGISGAIDVFTWGDDRLVVVDDGTHGDPIPGDGSGALIGWGNQRSGAFGRYVPGRFGSSAEAEVLVDASGVPLTDVTGILGMGAVTRGHSMLTFHEAEGKEPASPSNEPPIVTDQVYLTEDGAGMFDVLILMGYGTTQVGRVYPRPVDPDGDAIYVLSLTPGVVCSPSGLCVSDHEEAEPLVATIRFFDTAGAFTDATVRVLANTAPTLLPSGQFFEVSGSTQIIHDLAPHSVDREHHTVYVNDIQLSPTSDPSWMRPPVPPGWAPVVPAPDADRTAVRADPTVPSRPSTVWVELCDRVLLDEWMGVPLGIPVDARPKHGWAGACNWFEVSTASNRPPVAVTDDFTVHPGGPHVLAVTGNDTDPDLPSGEVIADHWDTGFSIELDLTSPAVSVPSDVTIVDAGDGTVLFTGPGNRTGFDVLFRYRVTDPAGGVSDWTEVMVRVTTSSVRPT